MIDFFCSQKHSDETGNITSNRSTTPLPDSGANGAYLNACQHQVSSIFVCSFARAVQSPHLSLLSASPVLAEVMYAQLMY